LAAKELKYAEGQDLSEVQIEAKDFISRQNTVFNSSSP